MDLGPEQPTDNGGNEQAVDEVGSDSALLELPVGDESARDEGESHHDSERVHGESAYVEQHRVHPPSNCLKAGRPI